jgi:hypothetical protein
MELVLSEQTSSGKLHADVSVTFKYQEIRTTQRTSSKHVSSTAERDERVRLRRQRTVMDK